MNHFFFKTVPYYADQSHLLGDDCDENLSLRVIFYEILRDAAFICKIKKLKIENFTFLHFFCQLFGPRNTDEILMPLENVNRLQSYDVKPTSRMLFLNLQLLLVFCIPKLRKMRKIPFDQTDRYIVLTDTLKRALNGKKRTFDELEEEEGKETSGGVEIMVAPPQTTTTTATTKLNKFHGTLAKISTRALTRNSKTGKLFLKSAVRAGCFFGCRRHEVVEKDGGEGTAGKNQNLFFPVDRYTGLVIQRDGVVDVEEIALETAVSIRLHDNEILRDVLLSPRSNTELEKNARTIPVFRRYKRWTKLTNFAILVTKDVQANDELKL